MMLDFDSFNIFFWEMRGITFRTNTHLWRDFHGRADFRGVLFSGGNTSGCVLVRTLRGSTDFEGGTDFAG